MSLTHSDVNTYSSEGRIIQVEYAMKAISLGTTTIGIVLNDCVVIASEKKLASTLQNPKSVKKHFKIYDTILAGISGISGDAGCIIEKCIDFCINHEKLYKEQISLKNLMDKICELALKFGEDDLQKKIYSRPFGVALLIGGFENGKPILYSIDPSGSYFQYKCKTIGSAEEVVQNIFDEEYNENDTREECIRKALSALKNTMRDKLNKYNVEISYVDKNGVVMLTFDEIARFIDE